MSKQRAHTPKAVELPVEPPQADESVAETPPVVVPRPTDPPPQTLPTTCGGCRHWRPRSANLGLCVWNPPSHVGKVTPAGPLCQYPVTYDTTPACSRAEPK